MSENDDKMHGVDLRSVLKDYIPHQLLRDVDESKSLGLKGLELMEFYIQNSNNKLRMYGTAEQLKENLEVYGDFPLNWKKYPSESMEIVSFPPSNVKVSRNFQKYPPKLEEYYNLKGELMYCKQDCLLYFHHSIHKLFNFQNIPKNLLEFMEEDEERLAKCYEFVKYDKEYFERIEEIFGNSEYSENPDNLVKAVKDFIWDYHGYFYANFATLNSEKGVHAVVRIFENDENRRFVMESELFNAINQKNRGRKKLECKDKNGYLKTIDMKEVYENYRDKIDGIDFIRTKIKHAPRAPVPIATPSGDHCVLAFDAFHETIRRFTSALKIFQKINHNTWHLVPKYVKFLEKYFPPEMEYQYFINLDLVKKLQLETDEYWQQFEEKPAKLIRDVGPNGFTAEDFKKELKYLGLNDVFPEIVSASKRVFLTISRERDLTKMGNYEMHSMIDAAQIKCFLGRFPSLLNFRHYQGDCGKKTKFEVCENCNEISQNRIKSITSEDQKHFLNDVVECSEKPENVGKSTKNGEEIKKRSEKMQKIISQEALSSENDQKGSPFPNVENFRKTLTEVLNGSGFFEVFEKMSKKSHDEIMDLKEPLVDQFLSGLKDGMKFRNSKIKETLIDVDAVNEQKKTLIEIIEKQEKEIVALKESEKEAKEKVEDLVRIGELVIQTKDDEITKLKEEISRMSKELKQAEKLKKNHCQIMKEKKIEIDSLISNISKSSEENRKLSVELSLQKTKEDQMKRSNEELIEKILRLQHNVNRLEKETEKLEKHRVHMESRQKQWELEMVEKDKTIKELQTSTRQQVEEQTRINQQLQETISIMSTEFEEQEKAMSERFDVRGRTIKKLLAQISALSDPQHSEEGPCPLRRQLMGLRKIKDNLEVRYLLKLAKDISQRLVALSSCPEIQEMATYEYKQFEGKHQMLLQEVCGNIQKLKDYGDVMTFPPLPEYPSFSDQFVNEYWNEIEKQKTSTSTSSESTDSGIREDSECLICFVEMTPEEKTLQCDHCRKILHLECASKWLKIHRSCPHCRREQLDPNEFPALI